MALHGWLVGWLVGWQTSASSAFHLPGLAVGAAGFKGEGSGVPNVELPVGSYGGGVGESVRGRGGAAAAAKVKGVAAVAADNDHRAFAHTAGHNIVVPPADAHIALQNPRQVRT